MNPSEESEFLGHEPCNYCGSSDAGSRYTDGHFFCHRCRAYEAGESTAAPTTSRTDRTPRLTNFLEGSVTALKSRGITEDTCRRYNYRVASSSKGVVQVADYRDQSGSIAAQHARTPGKDFFWVGEARKLQLWGQHLFTTGRMVVITEGEIDCLTVSQVQDNKWPVVSLPNGAAAASRSILDNLKWLDGFDSVILMFDMDEPGRAAANEVAELLPIGKCKIATLPFKDPNECLQQGQAEAIIRAIWAAKPWRPAGLVRMAELAEAIRKPVEWGLPWFLDELTQATYGRRYGELYALGAGTGSGKTDFLTQQITYDMAVLKEKVGVFFLEQQPVETGKRLAGKVKGDRFHVPDGGWTQADLDAILDQMVKDDLLFLYDHFGQTEWSAIQAHIRYLNKAEGVRIFYLDHLTALAAGQDDERKFLEDTMADIGGLVKELDIMIVLVSHLATPDGKPHEEGGRVTIRHFKGSRAIGFWCHFMFGLERDQQAEDVGEQNQSVFRVLKDRYTGNSTGLTIELAYDRATGLISSAAAAPVGF